jgi:hypothetical protein
MSEDHGIKIVNMVVLIVTLFCLPSFVIKSFTIGLEAASMYMMVNMCLILKLQIGERRYRRLIDAGNIERSGYQLLTCVFLRF